MNEPNEKPEFTMDVKVASFTHEGGFMLAFLFGVLFILISPFMAILGLIENDVGKMVFAGISLGGGLVIFVPFFSYTRGTIRGYTNIIKIPTEGFGIFKGKERKVRYEKIREIRVYFKFPRTDRIESIHITARHWTTLRLFGKGQSKYMQILKFFDKKGAPIRPKNWNTRRKITWKDKQMLVTFIMMPFLFIIILLVLSLLHVFFGWTSVSFIIVYIFVISYVVGIILFLVLYKNRRMALEDLYERED